jgi:hypothetical protein
MPKNRCEVHRAALEAGDAAAADAARDDQVEGGDVPTLPG